MFLIRRDTACRRASGLRFDLFLAFRVAAPHRFNKAGAALELLLEAGALISAEVVKGMVTDSDTLAAVGMAAPTVDLLIYDNLLSRQEGCL